MHWSLFKNLVGHHKKKTAPKNNKSENNVTKDDTTRNQLSLPKILETQFVPHISQSNHGCTILNAYEIHIFCWTWVYAQSASLSVTLFFWQKTCSILYSDLKVCRHSRITYCSRQFSTFPLQIATTITVTRNNGLP